MLKKNVGIITATFVLSISYQPAQAEWSDVLTEATKIVSENGGDALVKSSLANSDAVSGLKEALAKGVESAVNALGKSDGFSGNELVKIAVPESLKSAVVAARALGQGHYIDDFAGVVRPRSRYLSRARFRTSSRTPIVGTDVTGALVFAIGYSHRIRQCAILNP